MQLITCDAPICSVFLMHFHKTMSKAVGLTSFWISKTIQKLLLRTQAQEKVLRTGFSLISSEWGDGKAEAAGRGEHILQPGDSTASPFRAVSLWSLAITCVQISSTGHMQLHVSLVHIITIIVTTLWQSDMQTIN